MKQTILICLVFLGIYGTALADNQKFVCASSGGWPPLEFLHDGELTGYTIELLQVAGRTAGLQVEFLEVAETELVDRLNSGEYDAICSSMLNEQLRKESLEFSIPYLEVRQSMVIHYRKKIFGKTDWSDKKFGARKNTLGAQVIQSFAGTKKEYDTISEAMEDVYIQALDAVVCDKPVAGYYAQAKYRKQLKEAALESRPKPISVAVKKGDKKLLQMLNKGIARVKVRGIDLELQRKWFSQ